MLWGKPIFPLIALLNFGPELGKKEWGMDYQINSKLEGIILDEMLI